jgi:hypothetical protein
LHLQYSEHIAGDLGFIVLDNGDFRASSNHGDECRVGCGFERDDQNNLVPSRANLDLSLFTYGGDDMLDFVPRRT